MWSNQYWYYNIRCDANYSRSVPTEKIVVFLEGISVLKKKGALTFTNQPNFPWLNIACVNSNDGNFTGDLTTQTDNINLITIVASKPSLENEGK